jgi:hypothetical protein
VTACAGLQITGEVATNDPVLAAEKDPAAAEPKKSSYAAFLWAMLIARIYEVLPLVCPQWGDELKIVAFLTETDAIQRIMTHIGESATPPRIETARAPPDWPDADMDQTDPNESETAEPIPEFVFDQTVSW